MTDTSLNREVRSDSEVSERKRPEFGHPFVWCVEHDRLVSKCRQLASVDYGQPAFDNCQWITEAEMEH